MTKLIKKGQRKKPDYSSDAFLTIDNIDAIAVNIVAIRRNNSASFLMLFSNFFIVAPLRVGAKSLLSEVCDQPLQIGANSPVTTLIIHYYYYYVKRFCGFYKHNIKIGDDFFSGYSPILKMEIFLVTNIKCCPFLNWDSPH